MMQIYIADIRPLLEESLCVKVYDRLSHERKRKADACKFPKVKAASLAAGFLLDYGLKKQGVTACQVRYTESGAPVVENKDRTAGSVWVSLSHSGDYAVCAVANRPVGVDIQQIHPVRPGICRHFFSLREQQEFQSRNCLENVNTLNPEAEEDFFWRWAAKESYMKLTGEGMKLGFKRLIWEKMPGADILVDINKKQNEKNRPAARIRDEKGILAPAVVWEYRIMEGYCLTACLEEEI